MYYAVMIYITSSEKLTLMVKLMQMINNLSENLLYTGEGINQFRQNLVPESLKGAAIVISTVPIMLVYPFLQKYFVKGVMIGSLKE